MHKKRRGFTLVELLIVIVILGILAAMAIPKFAGTKEKAYMARMRSDLRNVASSEEAYFSDNAIYFGGTIPSAALMYNPSPGVTVVVNAADANGWAATASSVGTSRQCQVFYGLSGPNGVATTEGSVACTP